MSTETKTETDVDMGADVIGENPDLEKVVEGR